MTAAETMAVLTMRRARRSRREVTIRIVVPLVVIGLYIVGAIVVPMLYDFDPLQTNLLDRLKPPGSTLQDGSYAVFGTDQVGQDLFAQMMMGARVSLTVGAATLLVAGVLGVLVGLLAGQFGGLMDGALMRVADVQLAFPAILLAILLASVLGSSLWNVILVISITNWVVFARVTRGQVLTLRSREYVEAARTLGAGRRHLIFRTLLPGCVAPILVVATVEFGHVVLLEAALSSSVWACRSAFRASAAPFTTAPPIWRPRGGSRPFPGSHSRSSCSPRAFSATRYETGSTPGCGAPDDEP